MVRRLKKDIVYRKSFPLVITFIFLFALLFVLSLFLAFNYSSKKIENEFVSAKTNVLEESIYPYNNFFLNKLPEISYYNGYLDSSSTAKFVDTILLKYPFVSKVIFFDSEVKNSRVGNNGLNVGYFSVGVKNAYQFGKNIPKDSVKIFGQGAKATSGNVQQSFNELALKLYTYLSHLDTTRVPNQESLFTNFSNIRPNRIDYFNIPNFEDLKVYKQMINERLPTDPVYQQDMLSFELDPTKIQIVNIKSNIFQSVRIEPVTYDPIDNNNNYLTGEITLGGAFSAYKLYFISSKDFIKKEIYNTFFPIAGVLLVFFSLLSVVAYLIFRNLNINQKMFKLQYDFITNLTHEFKTPVSVIKIAGNNIKSAKQITEKEQKLYGRILDEEAEKLNGLMNKLLAFTQIENKSIKLNQDRIDLREFIESTIDTYLLKYADFKLTFEIKDVQYFTTDPILLGSLFDNLIENAYKYSPVDRKIQHISVELIKEKIVFKFVDKGIGIQNSEINNIFKKFYRVQNQYNQSGSVGLGLAFCKELVNFMNGDITVESEINKGTEFKIILPYSN